MAFLSRQYYEPLWADLIGAAITIGLGSHLTMGVGNLRGMLSVWVGAFLASLLFAIGLPKRGFTDPNLLYLAPALFAYAALAMTSVIIFRSQKV